MKTVIYIIFSLLFVFSINVIQAQPVAQPTSSQNYIYTYTTRTLDASGNPKDVVEQVNYFDGLGRPLQSVTVKGSPSQKDIILPFVYDQYGREVKKYLPFSTTASTNGACNTSATTTANWAIYGTEAPYAFAETQFENSPLNRVLKQGAPGLSWQLSSNNTVDYQYATNATTDIVLYWKISGTTFTRYSYNANMLYKTTVTDENNNNIIELKNLK